MQVMYFQFAKKYIQYKNNGFKEKEVAYRERNAL